MKVVLINGAGGSGKDTLVELFRTYVFNDYTVGNISTIDKIKSIAQTMGWKGEKDEKGRQFLADLKEAWTNYNNGANEEVLQNILNWEYDEQFFNKEVILFVHCREPEALQWFIEKLEKRHIDVCSLLVERSGIEEFSNSADKRVEQFEYDIIIQNNGTLEHLEKIAKEISISIKEWSF